MVMYMARTATSTDGLFGVCWLRFCRCWRASRRLQLVSVLLVGQLGPVCATPNETERELRTAECVAALDARSDELVRQLRAGSTEARPALVATLNAGAAFIGQAYLQGERDEARSQAQLSAARDAQKSLSTADLAERQSSCMQEGTRLFAATNGFSRFVINRLVDRRLHKLLGD